MSLAELRVRAKPKLFPKTFKDIFEKREAKTSAPPINNKPSNKKVANRKRKQTESDRAHSNSKNHDINVQPVHLFELCMRLQSKMFDPNACHKVSSTVYATLVKKMIEEEGRNAVTRKAIMDDLEMNSKQFEGACLFLVNQKLDGGALYDDSSKKKKKSSDDSDDDDACLTMDDIANELRLETSSFEKFVKEISVKIADLMRDMKHQDRKSGKNIQKQISNYDVVNTDDVLKSVEDPLETEDSEDYLFVPKEPRNCKPMFINFDEYSKWKQNILLSLVVGDETVDDATSRAACEISRNLQEEETIMKS